YWQYSSTQLSVDAKTIAEPLSLAPSIRDAIRTLDGELPIPAFRTMDAIVLNSVGERRFQMRVVLVFAVAALVLAAIGIYGVMSYAVAQRTSEIGLRLALGAEQAAVLRTVLGEACHLVGLGMLLGVLLALAAGPLLRLLL